MHRLDLEPFKPGLEPFNTRETLMAYPDSNVLIRIESADTTTTQTTFDAALEKRQLIEELSSYGVPVIHAAFVAGENHEYYAVTEQLEGICFNQEDYSDMPMSLRPKAEQFLEGLFNYLSRKVDSGESFMSDIYGVYQSMYVPEQNSFVLVDIGEEPQEDRSIHSERFQFEASCVELLLTDAYYFLREDPARYAEWHSKGAALLCLSAARNGVVMTKQQAKRLVNSIVADIETQKDIKSFEARIDTLVNSPSNQPYRDRMESIREQERLYWAEIE